MTLEERRDHLYLAEHDLEYRAAVLKRVDEDDAFFINVFVTTYDPRKVDGKTIGDVPMLLWPKQEECAREFGAAIDNAYDIGGEKSRDMGMTWIALAVILKRWLRDRGFSALIGTMTEELVDNARSPASLYWKLDKMLEYLPSWLIPEGYDPVLGGKTRSWMNMVNPERGNTISGRAPTERFPVGDRKTVAYYDDWAQWENGKLAWENAQATAGCRMATWTPKGTNHAYQLRFGKGDFKGVRIRITNIVWTDDPRKAKMAVCPVTGELYNVWKREQIGDPKLGIPGKMTLDQFRKDYELVYELSEKGRIYAAQMPYVRVGRFPFDPRFPTYTWWDYGTSDDCAIIFAQWDWEQYRLRLVESVIRSGQGIGYYVPFVLGRQDAHEILEHEDAYDERDLAAIARRTGWQKVNRLTGKRTVRYADHFGDPAGKARSISHNKSAVEVLREAGIHVHCKDTNDAKSYKGRIESTRLLLPFMDIDEEHCADLIVALQNYKWDKEEKKPEHNEHSHPSAAVEYGCVNMEEEVLGMINQKIEATARLSRPGGIFGQYEGFDPDDEDHYGEKGVYNVAVSGVSQAGRRGITGY